MPSLDFDKEKQEFSDFYSNNINLLEDAKTSFYTLINSLLKHSGTIIISKIESRVKDKEECIKKFNIKYRKTLESKDEAYSIREHISDLIALRVVCLYEDDIDKIRNVLADHFNVIDETNKIYQMEQTEDSFGYKGLHLDLKMGDRRRDMPEYKAFSDFNFEIQIRTIVQDSWSVLDHKIKYKKSIPSKLKRRINTLAALFELADREFREIRNATVEEIKKAQEDNIEETSKEHSKNTIKRKYQNDNSLLTAFGFLKIATHFFSEFDDEAHKVDGFTEEIVSIAPNITRTQLNTYMKEGIAKIKQYKADFEAENNAKETLNPYTMIRHCLYLGNKNIFSSILTNTSKETLEKWLEKQKTN